MHANEVTTYTISLQDKDVLALKNALLEPGLNFGMEQAVVQKLLRNPTAPRLTRQEITGCVMHLEELRDTAPSDPERTSQCNRLIEALEGPTRPAQITD